MLICFKIFLIYHQILGSIVVSIPACHAGVRGSIPRRGEVFLFPSIVFFRRGRDELNINWFHSFKIMTLFLC